MIVYGDPRQEVDPRDLLEVMESASTGLAREVSLELLLRSAELAQGLIDAEFESRGEDEWTRLHEHCMRLVCAAAELEDSVSAQLFRATLEELTQLPLPVRIIAKVPEGYAFYALSPTLYGEAARRWRMTHRDQPVVIIGLRSIGVSLAAAVTVALGLRKLPVTVRPAGPPFSRTLRIGPLLQERILANADAEFLIVDEGPGLSGSSFNGAADWLEKHGIPAERIHFFPGHGGDLGPQASAPHRERWSRCNRTVVDFEEFLTSGGMDFEAGTGNRDLHLHDISAGAWRDSHFESSDDWPPVDAQHERRKYLYELAGRTWLAKFVGLGHYGASKFHRARSLAEAGFTPPVRDFRNGFLIQDWDAAARPLTIVERADRSALIEFVAQYLAFLYREYRAPSGAYGATATELLQMAQFNAEHCLVAQSAETAGLRPPLALARWAPLLPTFERERVRVFTDNRMQAWEWLVRPDGSFWKTDAVDHHAAHDCIGAQDLSWDIAGAIVELSLSPAETEQLQQHVSAECAFRPNALLLQFCMECYLAFQAGAMALAETCASAEERPRLSAARVAYVRRLATLIETPHT